MATSKLNELLRKTSITIGVTKADIVTENSFSNITQCFKKLSSEHIHSLPVLGDDLQFSSFVDIWDVVHQLLASFSSDELKKAQIPKLMEWNGEYIRVLDEKTPIWDVPKAPESDSKIEEFRNITVKQIAKHPYVPLRNDATLADLIELMNSKHLHRVPIVDAYNSLERIVTQMDVIKWIDSNIGSEYMKDISGLTISQLSLDQSGHEVYKIDTQSTALEAFKLINDKKVSGVAVVDKENKLVGNISTSDLKVILHNADEFLHLYEPISDYLHKIKERSTHAPDKNVSCNSQTSFRDLIKSFTTNQVHRVFLTDDSHRVTGVISLTDVLGVIGRGSTSPEQPAAL